MVTGVVYVHPRSAFSDSTTSLASTTPPDKSFLKRLFNRHRPRATPSPTSSSTSSSTSTSTSSALTTTQHTSMAPSPHTHPLLAKPCARDELRPRTPLAKYSHLDGTISAGGEGFVHSRRVLAGRERAVEGSGVGLGLGSVGQGQGLGLGLGLGEGLGEGRFVQEWGFFIKCYAEGRFNLSNPPDPPPRRAGFEYLVAPTPPGEKARLEAVKACNVSLPDNANDKYHRLVQLAKKVFHTRMAAISFIDGEHELFKAEHALGRRSVARDESIGAHVLLLSGEPMVILDAAKDWRLSGNPLVASAPHVRFYAGAPIVTHDGHTIGTFSVFDTTPRNAFSVACRRKLMDFARLSMTEVELVMEEHGMMLSRCTSNTTTLERPSSSSSSSSSSLMTASPPPTPTPTPAAAAVAVLKRDAAAPITRPLPLRTHVPPAINIPRDTSCDRQSRTSTRISTMPTPPHTPSRPFSISTAASLALSYSHTFSPSPVASPTTTTAAAADGATIITHHPHPHPHPRGPPPPPATPGPITSMAEASFATSIIARSLNYDLVYLLRVSPVRSPEPQLYDDATACATDNMYTKILVAHGVPDPLPVFDAALHLRALRSAGGLVYRNPARSSEEDDVGYGLGILLPLVRDQRGEVADEGYCSGGSGMVGGGGGGDGCAGGIVLAAFTKEGGREGAPLFTADEVHCLREFGEAMKDILVRVDRKF
ncbi:uncharacterized protein H6S33_002316 [Morchella sextelata]|uniref:uncharacterized protein n=1 Tax=Morchella sextelata TaxID=1174677 RepID=UPI001D03E08C|nr:uncharacterized protein H6S33_002316 [Morchella sextelata]KAH0608264.1 hypothetical protein H6S33_002316 [Morchella sextelata]